MAKNSVEVLANEIKNLSEKMKEGFEGVHNRLDISNSKLIKHENLITELQKEDIKIEGKFRNHKMLWYIITTSTTVIGFLIGIIIKY